MSALIEPAASQVAASPDDALAYRDWVAAYDSAAPAIQESTAAADQLFCIFVTVGDTTAEAVAALARSLQRQTHPAWELAMHGTLHAAWPRRTIEELCDADPRIRLLATPPGAPAPAPADTVGRGAFVCVLEPGDTLARTALQEIAAAFAARQEMDVVYSDEDVIDERGRSAPRFKPDFSSDLMIAGNFIGQLAVYRRELFARAAVTLDMESPTLPYDLASRAVSAIAPRRVGHLPAVLCHRSHPPADWPLPAAVARPPIAGLLDVRQGEWPRARFVLPDNPPLVSIIVATRDRADLLQACLDGLTGRTDYPAIEIIVVDNGSREATAIALLDRLETGGTARVLRRPGPFNFAALTNAGAKEANGAILLLLNNDTEVLRSDWLSVLVSHAVRPGVGAVGAKLLYPDGGIQHAGMLLGPGGTATHVGRHAAADAAGYDGQLACTRDLSAVTGACLAIPRAVFTAVGGLDENLAVTWNDVDLCLKVRAAALRVIWTPEAVLLHHEAATRGLEADDPAKQARFERERAVMRDKWGAVFDNDPFLNANLLAHEDGRLILARPRHPRTAR